jgi:single-strand DNA-binding protein
MSRGIAHVTLVGNLTRDPELRQTPNGRSVCQLGVAVGSSYKDGNGEWVEKSSFFDVVVWGAQGENCAKYLAKGNQVAVDGRLDQRSWEAQDGTKRSKVEVVANTVVFPSRGGGGGESRPTYSPGSPVKPDSEDFKDVDFGDEGDIPF